MPVLSEDYEIYLSGVKNIENDKIREDYLRMAKMIMIKRTLIKIGEILIITLAGIGIIPNFF